MTAALQVEKRGENRRRVEPREAHEVDRPVERNQRYCIQISDYRMALDRLGRSHRVRVSSGSSFQAAGQVICGAQKSNGSSTVPFVPNAVPAFIGRKWDMRQMLQHKNP